MTPNRDIQVGKTSIRQAYEGFSKMMAFNVRFAVHSIVQMAPNWAYAHTSSSGTTTNRITHTVIHEANQELFIMKRDSSGRWHIAVYKVLPHAS
jgi:ketosteroid isomerase-like protein